MEAETIRVRFAPSPTGVLHLGSARTALVNWLFARKYGGSFILRIEDTDVERSDVRFETAIIEDMDWLGFEPDEGPVKGGPKAPYRQSQRQQIYSDYAKSLLESGKAYRCFCTLEELQEMKKLALARGEMPKYDGRCSRLDEAEIERKIETDMSWTIRFAVPAERIIFNDLIKGDLEFDSSVIGDFIIIRSNGRASFNFAVVVDDIEMEITHVIRGEDHLTNTARHCLLFDAIRKKRPFFGHHSLILGPDGSKLSKRHGAVSVSDYRKMGYLPQALINYLSLLTCATSGEEKLDREELIADFSMDRVSKSPAIFDVDKLNWLNGLYIRDLPTAELVEMIKPYLGEVAGRDEIWLGKLAEAIRSSLVVLSDAREKSALLTAPEVEFDAEANEMISRQESREALAVFESFLDEAGDLDFDEAREILFRYRAECKERGVSAGAALKPVRYALTGTGSGPELFYVVAILGSKESLRRVRKAIKTVGGER